MLDKDEFHGNWYGECLLHLFGANMMIVWLIVFCCRPQLSRLPAAYIDAYAADGFQDMCGRLHERIVGAVRLPRGTVGPHGARD